MAAQVPFEYFAPDCGSGTKGPGKREARSQMPTWQLISEYGGLSVADMIKLTDGDIRTFAVAMYPLFHGWAELSKRNMYINDTTHAGNIVYNVKTQGFVFIDYAPWEAEQLTVSVPDFYYKLRNFAKLAESIVHSLWGHRDTLGTVTDEFTQAARTLGTLYKRLEDMCDNSALEVKQAERVLDVYKQYLQTEHSYMPPG